MREENIRMNIRRGKYARTSDRYSSTNNFNYVDGFVDENGLPIKHHKHNIYNNAEYEDEIITEEEALYIVDHMYHFYNNKKYIGEKYTLEEAKEVLNKYADKLPENVELPEFYIAINAQYHDYCELYSKWIGGDINCFVFETAIEFWFNDVDFDGDKVWKYFMEM